MRTLQEIPEDKRVYIDESGIDRFIYRAFGRAPIGERIQGTVSGKRYQRESFIAGKCMKKIMAPFCYRGTCDTVLFNLWVEQFLVPELEVGQVVIMDNATFHKSNQTKKLVESAGCKILFLPPYSPDLNPIEKFWANFKKLVRKNLETIKNLSQAIDASFLTCLEGSV